jgi:tRNA (guanine37-N1)-methyltransferase
MKRFDVITLFPETINAYATASILGRAQKAKLLKVAAHQMRDYSKHKWNQVDFRPYGGGPGMVLEAESVVRAVEKAKKKAGKVKVIMTAAGGKPLTQKYAKDLVKKYDQVIIVCGRYEGVDARAAKILKAEEVSIGDYVLTGGEVPALAIIDAAARHIPGVLGKQESIEETRVASHDVYTRPEVLAHKGKKYRVPKVLLSGNHKLIDEWRNKRRSGGKQ